MSNSLIRTSKKLSWLLRHGANETGLTMDAAGWAPVDEVLRILRLTPGQLQAAFEQNDKQRLQIRDGRVRCSQGHSTAGTPVTAEALEATWTPWGGDDIVFHGTYDGAVDGIAAGGIVPQARTHVHLAASPDSKVGKRSRVHLLLHVSVARLAEAGIGLFEAPNGVLLARRVPVDCIVEVTAKTRRTIADEEAIRRRLLGSG